MRDKIKCTVRFGNYFLRAPPVYQLPAKAKLGDAHRKQVTKPTAHFLLYLSIFLARDVIQLATGNRSVCSLLRCHHPSPHVLWLSGPRGKWSPERAAKLDGLHWICIYQARSKTELKGLCTSKCEFGRGKKMGKELREGHAP